MERKEDLKTKGKAQKVVNQAKAEKEVRDVNLLASPSRSQSRRVMIKMEKMGKMVPHARLALVAQRTRKFSCVVLHHYYTTLVIKYFRYLSL